MDLILERMKTAGMEISRAEAGKLAQQSNVAILQRLHQGGESMPAFSHLNEPEVRSLLAYLKELADVPGAKRGQIAVVESQVRVGELIVKSTCHTCHSAVGPNPGPQELMNGAIPPLSSLTTRKKEPEFIHKVTQGAPVLMGTPPLPCRGRMPVFFYLSPEEAADVYLYLTLYPPSESANAAPIMASMQTVQPPSDSGTGANRSLGPNRRAPGVKQTVDVADVPMVGLPWWTGGLVAVMLAAGLVFTLREFKRLSLESAQPTGPAPSRRSERGAGWFFDTVVHSSFPERPTRATEIRLDDSE